MSEDNPKKKYSLTMILEHTDHKPFVTVWEDVATEIMQALIYTDAAKTYFKDVDDVDHFVRAEKVLHAFAEEVKP